MTSLAKTIIFGSGGHARVLIDTMQEGGDMTLVGLLTPDHNQWGKDSFGVPILGDDDLLESLMNDQGVKRFIVGVGSVGDASLRRKLFNRGIALGLEAVNVIHPRAWISSRAAVGTGVQVLAASIVNAGATLGHNIIINTGAIVEHDCWIGDHVHIATGAKLAGQVRVESGAHIGIGAAIRQGITIGEGAIVGAGAVVVRDVMAHSVVVGVPAGLLRSSS